MITQLRGQVAYLDAGAPAVELDVSGVVYRVLVPVMLWPEILALAGDLDPDDLAARPPLTLHVTYHATANQPVPVLVGFLRRAERAFFEKFTSVEGIGPAKAVKSLNVSVSTVARAIEQEDRATLVRLPGIGPRAADKIIAALRGKVVAEAAMNDGALDEPVDTGRMTHDRLQVEVIDTVAALGYSRAEARRWVEEALKQQPGLMTPEELTLAVLRGRDGS